ncbi:circumsporozoite protein [Drosophila nasuta]|uniref:circumsporozoite protein n=1 Tax=Drosophila nasuta TaxID=42062 RepID=UPI00295F248A|nr:circumsporozoite protein [Drosophila nasuta]
MSYRKNNYNPQRDFNRHKNQIKERSKTWGQQKFRPTPYVRAAPPPVPEEAKPWQHVKNDIVGDEQEARSADRFNMDSQQAKDILKEREKNHRRNVIEAQRNQTTTWESFNDNDNADGSSKAKAKSNAQENPNIKEKINAQRKQKANGKFNAHGKTNAKGKFKAQGKPNANGKFNAHGKPYAKGKPFAQTTPNDSEKQKSMINITDQRQLNDKQRNVMRRKLTRVANRAYDKGEDMDFMINDLRNNYAINPNNKFRN